MNVGLWRITAVQTVRGFPQSEEDRTDRTQATISPLMTPFRLRQPPKVRS
jgi:hypothetical protein